MKNPESVGDIFQVDEDRAKKIHMEYFDWLEEKKGQDSVLRWEVLSYLPEFCESREDITIREAIVLTHVVTHALEVSFRDRKKSFGS